MFFDVRRRVFLLVALLFTAAAYAQQSSSPTQATNGRIYLDVVVTPKSGPPVRGLQRQDFVILDNNVAQTVTSFQAVDGEQAAIEVILVIDAVNIGYQNLAYAREEIGRFLRAEGGNLAYPTALAVLQDTGFQMQDRFSSDGKELSTSLDQYTVGLRDIPRSAGFYGAAERFQISLNGLQELVARERPQSGRKIILWISPGWAFFSGPGILEQLDTKQQQQIFDQIVSLSTQFRQGRITLYTVDPLGTSDAAGFRTFEWKEFVKGVSKVNQAQWGDLALQVLATQSGGLALNSDNDVAGLLRQCLADLGAYYELSFDPSATGRPNEYHALEVRVAKHGLTARTHQGYYSQPTPHQ